MSTNNEIKNSIDSFVKDDFSTLKEYDTTYKTQVEKLNDQMYRISRIPGKKIFPVNTQYKEIVCCDNEDDSDYKKIKN